MFEYVWSSLDQPIDVVKHNTKNFIKNIIETLVVAENFSTIDQFLTDILTLPSHSKPRLISLSCLVQSYDIIKILEVYPNIVKDNIGLIVQETAISNLITDLCNNVVVKLHKQGDDGWYDQVLVPLIQLYNSSSSTTVAGVVTNVLNAAAKLDVKIIDKILDDKSNLPPKLALICLKMSRDQGRPWEFKKHQKLLTSTLQDFSEDIRLQSLTLCVESHSSVEVFSQEELSLIFSMILRHLDLQSPSSQQILTVLVHKMIQRINDGAAALCKKLTQKKFEKEFQQMEKTLSYYNNLLQDFVYSLIDNLYPGANYPRRTTVLDILTSLGNIVGFSHVQNRLSLTQVMSETVATSLVQSLYDSYEVNKEKSLALLRSLPASVLQHDHPDQVRSSLDTCVRLMTSNKPPDSLTSGYLTRLLMSAPALHWVLADKLSILQASQYSAEYLLVVYLRYENHKLAEIPLN